MRNFFFLLCSCSFFASSCQKSTSKSSENPSFAAVRLDFVGAFYPGVSFDIKGFSISLEDCKKHPLEVFVLEKKEIDPVMNLLPADEGCVAKLASINILTNSNIVDTLTPENEEPYWGSVPVKFSSTNSKISAKVTGVINLSPSLGETERVLFHVQPLSEGNLVAWRTSSIVPSSATEIPGMTPAIVINYGEVVAGSLDFGFYIQCEEPLVLWTCRNKSIYDYRYRIEPKPAVPWTDSEVLSLMAEESKLVRPSIGSLHGNGIRTVYTSPGPLVEDFVFLAKIGDVVRVFEIDASRITSGTTSDNK